MPSMPFNVKSGALLPVLRTWGDEAVLTMPNHAFVDIIYLLSILRITIINVVDPDNIIPMDYYYGKESISNNNNNNNNNNTKLLPIILLVASAAAIVAMFILQFFGVYFFFFFLPLTFSLPWSIKRLWGRKAKKQWNVEDLR